MINNLRILHVIDHFYPILGYQEAFLAKSHGKNNDTLVITSDRFEKAIFTANKDLLKRRITGSGYFVERGIKVLRLPSLFDVMPFNKPWLIGLEKSIVNSKPDLIIVHGVVSITSARIARLKSKLPLTSIIFDDHMTKNTTRGWVRIIYSIFKRLFAHSLLRAANGFVAVTSETKYFLEDVYGIPSNRIAYIPLGVDRNIFRHDPEARRNIRKKHGIKDDELVFIYAGKIIPEKGIHLLVNAGISLCKSHFNVKIMLVGGSYPFYLKHLQERIGESGVNDRFIFVDAMPNKLLPQFYNAADVGVWPLQCSLSMIEAMACGLPIVISDKSGTLERVSEGTGLLYHEGDVNDLKAKMEEMLDEKRRNIMSRNAETYTKELDWDMISSEFINLAFKERNQHETVL